ncbi:MAG: hypothetical protein B6D56_02970 [Candidatus Omnitrophica bacterium 4484_70.1]|nr:MAG: hypothetical protein B6D56_02970 [Candidatus Omnitrophica bacterium 4484_70.1]
MNLEKFKKICIIGFKKSGISLCRLLLSLGKKVKVSEIQKESSFNSYLIEKFKKEGVEFEFGAHTRNFFGDCDLVVVSPGVNLKETLLRRILEEASLPTVGEIELASWINKSRIVAVTGTNGKTTVSFLTFLLLRKKFSHVFLGGNIGIPFSSFVRRTTPSHITVLEVSSFQLENIVQFRPYVSCVLNLEPDHLDRYSDFQEYKKAKEKIFVNQKEEDYALINRNIFCCQEWRGKIKAKVKYFGGEENDNFSCLNEIASIFDIDPHLVRDTFFRFKGLSHRMQKIAQVKGVTFINDSKATNPSSTIWALKNLRQPVILIAGGKDKGLDYSSIIPFINRIKKINLFGEAKEKIADSFKTHHHNINIFSQLEEAVRDAFFNAQEGDVILFSPMCSSFDMFSSYIERGKFFTQVVNSIKNEFG